MLAWGGYIIMELSSIDHKCNANGHRICGGDGWVGLASIETNLNESSWCSGSCSICGRSMKSVTRHEEEDEKI